MALQTVPIHAFFYKQLSYLVLLMSDLGFVSCVIVL